MCRTSSACFGEASTGRRKAGPYQRTNTISVGLTSVNFVRMVAIMADSRRHFHHLYNPDHNPVIDSVHDNAVIQRVPVIQMVAVKCEKKEAHKELPNSQSDVTTDHSDTIVRNAVQNKVSVTVSDDDNVTNDITSSMLGVLFPHNPSDIQVYSQQFNLEFLENNFVSNLIGTVDTENIDTIAHEVPPITAERDILRDAVGGIVNDGPCLENKISERNNPPAKSVRKGRKRGRKLGYRSENSNADNALCGVCGEKVRIFQFYAVLGGYEITVLFESFIFYILYFEVNFTL